MDDFRFVKDSGTPVGFWLRDASALDKPGAIEAILMMYGSANLLDAYTRKKYRKVANTHDTSGGCFVMFGATKAPGEP
jgi:hypothetical protein